MKKILFSASTYGHLKNFHQPYIKWFYEHDFEVHITAGGDKKDIEYINSDFFIPFKKNIFSIKNFFLAFKLSKIIRTQNYDIISVHTGLGAFFTRLAVILSGKRPKLTVYTAHGLLFDDKTNAIKKAVLLGAEKITAPVTDFIMTMNIQDTRIVKRYNLCRGKVSQIDGMGVDFTRFERVKKKDRASLRKSIGLDDNDFAMVYAADFSKRKNQKMLIKAMDKLPKNAVLLFLGNGGTLEECKSLSGGKRVKFLGHVSNVEDYYYASDICVSASRIEGLPFNIMEAMACSLPVIASDVKGHEDLVADGLNGFLFSYNDEEAFCKEVLKLMDDENFRKIMGQNAYESVQKYRIEEVLPKVIQQYKEAWESKTKEKFTI